MAEPASGGADVARIRAPNPGPMTLTGTNTYVVAREPAYVIDPGPDDSAHLDDVRAEGEARGGIAGTLLTHSHADHSAGVKRLGVPLLWGSVGTGDETTALADSGGPSGSDPANLAHPPDEIGSVATEVGPFAVIQTPGHASDHVVFVWHDVCFCGDLILGHGSTIVPPRAYGGSLRDYMASLHAVRGLGVKLLAPGHGEWITDPGAKVAEYLEHRAERERLLVEALAAGERSRSRLLAAAWADVPTVLRPAAAAAMQAHIEKLEAEGRLSGELVD
ncbi:MAG: MBL fold metallo-hydrolase [Actinomycetota bacterium]|nr:MBL fold metallo-hydrolase [Actinomycetota bacterium]